MAQSVEHVIGNDEVISSILITSSKKLKRPFGVALIFIQADEGGLVCKQCACALYVIATKSRMASRASVYYCRRLDTIHPFGMIPCSPHVLRTYRLRRILYTPYGVIFILKFCFNDTI